MRVASSAVSVTAHIGIVAVVLFMTAKPGRSNPPRDGGLPLLLPPTANTSKTSRAGGGGLQIPNVPSVNVQVPVTPIPTGWLHPGLPPQIFSPPVGPSGMEASATWGTPIGAAGPQVLTGPVPVYPELLRQAGIQGHVLLEAIVDTTGHVRADSILVVEATHPAFVAPARHALLATLFRPAVVGGKPIAMRVRVPFEFLIQGLSIR